MTSKLSGVVKASRDYLPVMTIGAGDILVVEDDADLRRLLCQGLTEEGYSVSLARTGREALELVATGSPDLVVLDIGLPDSDGRDVCQALRSEGSDVPILFLTASDAASDRISGFGAGGDDYLIKPFEFAELVARLEALARRRRSPGHGASVGDLHLDPITHSVRCGDEQAALTPTEFRLLGALVSRPEEAVRRRHLIAAAWPNGAIVHDNTLDVYIARLRKKIVALGSAAVIYTVHGVGYRLQ